MCASDVDLERVLAWVELTLGPVTSVRELTGGWTSTMLALSTADTSAVARLMTRQPWRAHGEELATREQVIQRMLADGPVPAPRTLALDATGAVCGVPAHLMTLLPGTVDLRGADRASCDALARAFATTHDVVPTAPLRTYQSWAWEAKFVVPPWATRPRLWETAFERLRQSRRGSDWAFLHRDFQPRNVLWEGDRIVGIVDWDEASWGPRWLDVAHCSTHLAMLHGQDAAAGFADAYATLAGVEPDPYFDVMDIVGNLPAPGRDMLIADPAQRHALETRLATVLA